MKDERVRPHVSRAMRELVYQRSGGKCQRCGKPIEFETFHVAHLRAHVHGGPLIPENLEAWDARCNFAQRSGDARDTRLKPREWQLEALDPVVARIINDQAATVSAAPGAGKTVFAGLVFEALREADFVDRLVVVVPRLTIVDQWVEALRKDCHIELKPFAAMERPGQDGVVTTYQSLTTDSLDVHRVSLQQKRTLLVLDEVHHLGEPTKTAWAQRILELAGAVVPLDLHVAGVLNMSGTLWRSRRSERISTVRYKETSDGKLVSDVDYEIGPERLITAGEMRPIDLYRLDARVRVQDWQNLQVIDSNMADLDEQAAGAALKAASEDPEYRAAFIRSVLDRLEMQHRSLGNYHVKALIVAANQIDARAFRQEVDDQMKARGLAPLAALAISDEPEAKQTLESFRRSKRVGVLCTVDMAGEGYDCPEIAVVGYATNKRTAMYIRQVVGRGQRVTDRERELGIIPANIVVPDVPELVQKLLECLQTVMHEIVEAPPAPERTGDAKLGIDPRFFIERYVFTEFVPVKETISVAHSDGNIYDFARDVIDALSQQLERAHVQPSLAPRILMSLRRMAAAREASRPFEVLDADSQAAKTIENKLVEPVSLEEECRMRQTFLRRMEGWWAMKGDPNRQVSYFIADANRAAGLPSADGRETTTPERLDKVIAYERDAIRHYCQKSGQVPPRWM